MRVGCGCAMLKMADGACRINAQEVQDSVMGREKMRYGR